jgi:hypothetical protein
LKEKKGTNTEVTEDTENADEAGKSGASSRMGIFGIHPTVFVRVASKGLTGYGTWKSV